MSREFDLEKAKCVIMAIPMNPKPGGEDAIEAEWPANIDVVFVDRFPTWRRADMRLEDGCFWYNDDIYLDVCRFQWQALGLLNEILDAAEGGEHPLFLDTFSCHAAHLLADPFGQEGRDLYSHLIPDFAKDSDPQLNMDVPHCLIIGCRRTPYTCQIMIPVFVPNPPTVRILYKPGTVR